MDTANTSYVKLLRETAQTCPDVLHQRLLKEAATELERAVSEVFKLPSLFNLQQLNAAAVRAHVVFMRAPPLPTDPTRNGSLREGARLAA